MKMKLIAATASLFVTMYAFGAQIQPIFGIDFSPIQATTDQTRISEELAKIQGYAEWVRIFDTTYGMEHAGAIAHQFGFKVALGVVLTSYQPYNDTRIPEIIAAANRGEADMVIVGNDTLLHGYLTGAQLVSYINTVRASIPAGIPVTTADDYDALEHNPEVMAACDIVLVSINPFSKGVRIDEAMNLLDERYRRIVQIAGTKEVWIDQAGWQDGGDSNGASIANKQNAAYFFFASNSWARTNNIKLFCYQAYDYGTTLYAGQDGYSWGIWTYNAKLKPYRNLVFQGHTLPPEAYLRDPSPSLHPPSMELTSVGAYGSFEGISGIVSGVPTRGYELATYIFAASGWWNKPSWNAPKTSLGSDGTFHVDTVTGGVDNLATDFLVFLVPRFYSPPFLAGGNIPGDLYSNAVAYLEFPRSSDFSGFTNRPPPFTLQSVAVKRTFGGANAGDTVTVSCIVPLTNASVLGSDVKVTAAGVEWQFEPLSQKGSAKAVMFDGKTGVIRVTKATSGWSVRATLKTVTVGTQWNPYGLIDATLRAPGIPVFIPVTVAVNGTNSYSAGLSGYYLATAGKVGRMSGSSKVPSN